MALFQLKNLVYISVLLLVITFGITGTYYLGHHGNFNEPITTLWQAAYFTVVTVATVGYGDIYPVTDLGRAFTIALIVFGLGAFFATITTITGNFINERVETFSGRLSAFEKRALKNHFLLLGVNSTNMYLAEKLKERNERYVIVSSNKDYVEELKANGYKAYLSQLISSADLMAFRPDLARAIVIDLTDSSKTVYVLLAAKEIAKNARIIVISTEKETEHHLRQIAGGKTLVVNPADIAARVVGDTLFKDQDKT